MRRILFVISLSAVIMGLMQCRKPSFNFDEAADGGQLHEMTFSASGDGEKGSFNDAFKYVWDAKDKIRVYATTDENGAFDATHGKYCGVLNLESGAGGTNATFYSSGINLPDGTKRLRFMHYGSSLNVTDGAVEADFSTQTGAKAAVSEKLVAVFETAINEKHKYSGPMETQFAIVWINLSNLGTSASGFSMVNVANNKLQVDKYGNVKKIAGNVVNLQNSNLNSYYLIVMDEAERTYHTFANNSNGKCADLISTFSKNKFYHGGTDSSPSSYQVTNILPDGALPGVMKISQTEKIHFSKGNLYWNPDGDQWLMESNQWDIRDSYGSGNIVGNFYWTLHCFGTQEVYVKESKDYLNWDDLYCDKNSIDRNCWTLLENTQWKYVIENNPCAVVQFNNSTKTNTGLIILPYGSTETASNITTVAKLKSSYAVLLPGCGLRNGKNFINTTSGYYWSRNRNPNEDDKYGYSLNFDKGNTNPYMSSTIARSYGAHVRLVSKKYQ